MRAFNLARVCSVLVAHKLIRLSLRTDLEICAERALNERRDLLLLDAVQVEGFVRPPDVLCQNLLCLALI